MSRVTMNDIAALTPEQQAHSERLVAAIRADIEQHGGWISFARFMELALYAPGLGYYTAGSHRVWQQRRFRHCSGTLALVQPLHRRRSALNCCRHRAAVTSSKSELAPE